MRRLLQLPREQLRCGRCGFFAVKHRQVSTSTCSPARDTAGRKPPPAQSPAIPRLSVAPKKHCRAAEHLCPQPQHRYKAEPRHSLRSKKQQTGGESRWQHYSGSAGAGTLLTRHQHGTCISARVFAILAVNRKQDCLVVVKSPKAWAAPQKNGHCTSCGKYETDL